ncbi:MAG: formylglycine-generating enzyme family protein [Verrucomicrobia bacterium]|nr:formylglycine-generating enzyme family protein [Verrucomicrobiota bacterium]
MNRNPLILLCGAWLASAATAAPDITNAAPAAGMVRIVGGAFRMGAAAGVADNQPAHTVKVGDFLMDTCEVTQESYARLIGICPAKFEGDTNPVERVRWTHAAQYCNARSREEGLTLCYDEKTWRCDFAANGYRLPTEAEWEYACRAGTTTAYSFGDAADGLRAHGWFKDNSNRRTHPVGGKTANAWGLRDMHGNVAEWCNDWYDADYYRNSPADNPRGPDAGTKRVIRGGHWSVKAEACTSYARASDAPTLSDICLGYETYGFRCVRSVPAPAR